MKKCSKCKKKKQKSEFYKDNRLKSGLSSRCKGCDKIKNKSYQERIKKPEYKPKERTKISKEEISKKIKEYRKTKNGRFAEYKGGAKYRNIEFNLSKKDFLSFWKKECYYCRSEIETIGLDRIDSKKGYSNDNVVSCCGVCNRMKMDMKKDEFLLKIKHIYKNLKLNRE